MRLCALGWLTDNNSAAQRLSLQSSHSLSGLKPSTELSFQSGQLSSGISGEVVQIVHVRGSYWCVVSTLGCESGVVCVYACLQYKNLSNDFGAPDSNHVVHSIA